MQDVYRVVIQSGIDPTMPLDLIACADKSTHLATTGEGTLQGLEPVSIWVTSFVVGGAESFECADDEMMVCTIIVVLEETEEVKQNLARG